MASPRCLGQHHSERTRLWPELCRARRPLLSTALVHCERPRRPRAAAAPTAASQSQAPALFSLQMSQGNPNLGSLLNIKTEAEGSPAVESSPFLGKAVKALVQEKLSEPWKVYLRR